MSEEILKALMQLFALITKQDGGIGQKEIDYVRRFLEQQIGVDSASEYLQLYKDTAAGDKESTSDKESGTAPKKKLTSVLDSVRMLKLCKQISKTINQRQKLVVLVRILELVNAEYKLTEQRLGIVKTVADIFRIDQEEYESIFTFVTSTQEEAFSGPNHLVIYPLFFLRIPSVELYFVKFTGQMEVFLNGLGMRDRAISLFASGSTLRLPVGLPVYYSDIAARFLSERSSEKITLEADHLSYQFPNQVQGLNDISFNAHQGNLVGIMGSSGAGKT
ncbi:MAG: hypothetical protein KAR16_01830, partial [Bacteroidales bacterium]|nr:hypothetical protein [Bacteroidales bacterium]